MNEHCLDDRPNPLHIHSVDPQTSGIHTSGSSAQASNPISEVFVDPLCASRYILPRPQGASPLPHLSGHQQQQQQQPRVSFMEEVVISSGGVNQINQPSQQHQRASYPARAAEPATVAREQRSRHVRSNSQLIGVVELSELEQMALAKHEQNKELYQMVHDAAMRNWREREASRDQTGDNN